MNSTLIIYSTIDGQTLKITKHIERVLMGHRHKVIRVPIEDAFHQNIDSFDQIIIGSSIRYGKHHKAISRFILAFHHILNHKPSAFFSVNLVARKPEKSSPATNPYVKKFLHRIPWKPTDVAVFAGFLDYPNYTFFDKIMIRLIMKLTKGPTDPNQSFEFTDWKSVDKFAQKLVHPKRN